MTRSRRHAALTAVLALAVLVVAATARGDDRIRHSLTIELDPLTHQIEVVDRIQLPAGLADGGADFLLSSALEIRSSDVELEKIPAGDVTGFYGINGSSVELGETVELARYHLAAPPESGVLTVTYGGEIDFGLSDQKEEYTRGFRETAGVVGEEGVYLAGSGFWVPYFDDHLVEFDLAATVPDGWHLISQGNGTSRGEDGWARWDSGGPMDEIYLVGGPLVRYSDTAGAVETEVYLHEEDDALANKYLTTTAQYLEMYRGLIGPYPYGKFALVENFWETGYGMPSFTLLGPTIIRFPFILHSSYPHEILHNWWGNSVFVDYSSGNWCEGLTAYMADHLIQEGRGTGDEYRRAALQKYRDFVREGRDFPLSEFRSRHSAATEAVGYGKTLMGFHMLRRHLGDDAFRQALVRFGRSFKGKRASFDDLRVAFERAGDTDLGWFFEPWVTRAGAPALRLGPIDVQQEGDAYTVSGPLDQIQQADVFEIEVPVVVGTLAGAERIVVRSTGRSTPFEITTFAVPTNLAVDPQFDVFRLLDPRETPPSIGQIFGEPAILAVLPSAADAAVRDAYRALVEGWVSDSHAIEIVLDSELASLPDDRGVWILGRQNTHRGLFADDPGVDIDPGAQEIRLGADTAQVADHSFIVIRRHPDNLSKAVGWLTVEPIEAFPGMGRKLPHYGKYSYLAFEGDEPTNVIKGQWATLSSPLQVVLAEGADVAPELEQRTALAELAPVFSEKTLMAHAAFLGSPELEGRGVGTAGLGAAADYIARQFEAIGLEPAGDDGGYFQRFTVAEGPDGEPHEVVNVIGRIPGSRDDWSDQSFIVSAHYDHLGRGWPDARSGNEGVIHPGADDNASGVAVMLELAKNLAAGAEPLRSLVFVAFGAEEAGHLGSKHFVEHPEPFTLEGMRGVINIDTVGRLGEGVVSILGTGTADEWQHIFRGAGFVTGVKSRNVPASAEGSDQWSFIQRGIPGVQIFATAHEDYHAPGDTVERLDGAGLVKVATLVKEAVVYMGEREEPLNVTIEGAPEKTATEAPAGGQKPTSGRRVRLGTVPDFAFTGEGVRVSSVVPDSPAAAAGLQEGDILVRIDEAPIADLQGYAGVLRTLEVGQTVALTILRQGVEMTVSATLEAR